MCGLTLSIRLHSVHSPQENDDFWTSLCSACSSRGPDAQQTYTHVLKHANGEAVEVKLCASVLGLRGRGVTEQPIIGQRGVLGWNGQLFDGLALGVEENDTKRIFDLLESGQTPEEVLSCIEGPYAFIYINLETQTVHYQLDPLSRRSLLVHTPDAACNSFYLSSVRSGSAREMGVEMKVLDGGQGGVIRLEDLKRDSDGVMDLSSALSTWPCLPVEEPNYLTRISSLNPAFPLSAPVAKPDTNYITTFISKLQTAVTRHISNIPLPVPDKTRVAILFSGGVDCTFLAYLVHLGNTSRCLPKDEPIDLINVAFARPTATPNPKAKLNQLDGTLGQEWLVPDRISGLDALEELKVVAPREWRFVEINVTHEEAQEHRQRVMDLMYPSQTEMDLSLAFPLYFASRGKGFVENAPYVVRAKVYISGLGADEQLGGYSRHRHAFTRRGWEGLINELQLDIDRLPTRNVSRDDRILSSHARDARYPYLDLAFVDYLSSLPVWVKCNPSLDSAGGDKRLLRLAAQSVGLIRAGQRVKRAMQFGTRSSKLGTATGARKGERLVD